MRSIATGLPNPVARAGDRLGGGAILGQVFSSAQTQSVVVPAGAPFVFAEALGTGGRYTQSSGRSGGGGAGSDAILAVKPGETLTIEIAIAADNVMKIPSRLSRGSTLLLSANNGGDASSNAAGVGGTGKYPGSSGISSRGGTGGGRFAGETRSTTLAQPPGSGGYSSASEGTGIMCLTFFATYDDALAFAKSVYGGTWAP